MRTAVVALLVLGLCAVASADRFDMFVKEHGKSYVTPTEKEYRRKVFFNNLRIIDGMNGAVANRGENTVYNVTLFADMTQDEFAATYLTYKQPAEPIKADVYKFDPAAPIPSKVDWRSKGCITEVKNQAQCGSCWAFSATETVESYWNLAGNPLTDLSPQQVTACTPSPAEGCDGGFTSAAFNYLEGAGLESASAYPYTAGNGVTGQCNYNSADVVAHISGWKYAAQNGNEQALQSAVATVGPISICVDASSWQFYTGGVLSSNCGQQLDHCVQLVGYNQNAATPYYEVRNSWTAQWGINGYIWVAMNQGNLCGIANDGTFVTI